ncbi:hypothetical protein MK489_04640 [Myxococcota bacterium]|nr:hypothetical protein [Myxococcota bacterium]
MNRGFTHRLGPRGVRDLIFISARRTPTGELWAATEQGLYQSVGGAWLGPLLFSPGAARRTVSRLLAAEGRIALATDRGVFLSDAPSADELGGSEFRWRALPPPVPRGQVQGLALGQSPAGERGALECWALIQGELWRVVLSGTGDMRKTRVERRALPNAPRGDWPVDLALGLPGADVAILYPTVIAGLNMGTGPEISGTWRVWHPVLPPGARALRVHSALGRVWLATDRGLLEAPTLAGPWRRTGSPVGFQSIHSLAGSGQELFVVGSKKLWSIEKSFGQGAVETEGQDRSDPTVVEVQRVALEILDRSLGQPARRLHRVRARGWWPEVSVRAAHDGDEFRDFRYDQTYTYGDTRHLYDWGRDHASGYAVSLALTWDLRDTVFDPEEIGVSRESRAVVALRNDVLDEITQLYFDRLRTLAAWNAYADKGDSEAVLLKLRAEELAAGLDAWTDGWFSRHAAPGAP